LGIVHKTLTFVVASDVAFEQIVDAVEQGVGAVEHIEFVAQCEVIFVQPVQLVDPRVQGLKPVVAAAGFEKVVD
jgi:hypothetical protein